MSINYFKPAQTGTNNIRNEIIFMSGTCLNKKLTLWILFFPMFIFAQTTIDKSGTITIDFGRKNKQLQADTTKVTYPEEQEEDAPAAKPKKEKKVAKEGVEEAPNPKNGLFKALFIAGLNATQIDGDLDYGYRYFGAHVGVGTLVKFHKNFSVSMELLYNMKGARNRPNLSLPGDSITRFTIAQDYIEVPVSINVHDKKLVIFNLGLSVGALVRFKQTVNGIDQTDNPISGTPKRFDLSAQGGLHFLIKQKFGIGARFSYSLLALRPAFPGPTKVRNQYNNVVTIRFMYILDAIKKK